MIPVHLRLPGSHWGNRQVRLHDRNKAVLILLIVRNVLIETRKRLIHMALNQSHAPCTEFRKTLVEQLCCPLTNSCRDSVLLTPAEPPQDNVSSPPCPCLNLSNTTSIHNASPLTLVLHWWFYLLIVWTSAEKHSRRKSSCQNQMLALYICANRGSINFYISYVLYQHFYNTYHIILRLHGQYVSWLTCRGGGFTW